MKRDHDHFSQYCQPRLLAAVSKERRSQCSIHRDAIFTVQHSTNAIDITTKSLRKGHGSCILKVGYAWMISRRGLKSVNRSTTDQEKKTEDVGRARPFSVPNRRRSEMRRVDLFSMQQQQGSRWSAIILSGCDNHR